MHKRCSDWHRHYRNYVSRNNERAFQVVIEETDLFILAKKDLSAQAVRIVSDLRAQIKAYCLISPCFRESLEPVSVPHEAPLVIRRMEAGARLAGVGPFAAVAGVIAQMTAEALYEHSSEVLVENGGDTFLISEKERFVGLLPDASGSAHVGLKIPVHYMPLSVCASSATIGHSLSFGHGELVAVASPDAAFADSCATALCNMLKSADDIPKVLEEAHRLNEYIAGLEKPPKELTLKKGHPGLLGLFAQCQGKIGIWGNLELDCVQS